MVSNKEIKLALESKRKEVPSEEYLQILEVPYDWTGNSYLFDFDSIPVETLSEYIHYIFRQEGYRLDEGTLINGIYLKISIVLLLLYFLLVLLLNLKLKYIPMEIKHI